MRDVLQAKIDRLQNRRQALVNERNQGRIEPAEFLARYNAIGKRITEIAQTINLIDRGRLK